MEPNCTSVIIDENYADFLIESERFIDIQFRENNPQLCYTDINNQFVLAHGPMPTSLNAIIRTWGYNIYPKLYGLLDSPSLEASGVTRLRNIPSLNLSGQGILIGIVDTGIDYTHPTFIRADGSSKVHSIWDQGIESSNQPSQFPFGTVYSNLQINAALASDNPLSIVPSTDEIGHGTMLAGIACGNENLSANFSGVVPLAEIVVVKLKKPKKFLKDFYIIPENTICYSESDIMFGVEYLTDLAEELERPISICIGLGSTFGGHDERNFLSRLISYRGDRSGVAMVVAAGNEGDRGHHFLGSVEKGSTSREVELRVGPNEYGFTMELWGTNPNTFSIDILSPTGEYVPRIPARLNESREIQFVFERTIILIDYILVEGQTGDQLILMRFRNPTEGIWKFNVYASTDLDSTFHIWLPLTGFISPNTYFTEPNPDYTITCPGNSIVPIVVTTYNTATGSLYLHASRGFSRTNRIVPSFAAPGVNITIPDLNNGYTTSSGSSLAAAHTTGVAALMLEWGVVRGNYTQLDSVEINKLLIRGAKRDPAETYPNRAWGYGILDVYNTFSTLRGDSSS